MKLILYIVDLIAFWAAYNFLQIIKINYINPIMGLDINQEFFNLINNYIRPVEKQNGKNLLFYFIILIICLLIINNF
jgi:hypothetical protein